jgi:hypothetical protein
MSVSQIPSFTQAFEMYLISQNPHQLKVFTPNENYKHPEVSNDLSTTDDGDS